MQAYCLAWSLRNHYGYRPILPISTATHRVTVNMRSAACHYYPSVELHGCFPPIASLSKGWMAGCSGGSIRDRSAVFTAESAAITVCPCNVPGRNPRTKMKRFTVVWRGPRAGSGRQFPGQIYNRNRYAESRRPSWYVYSADTRSPI